MKRRQGTPPEVRALIDAARRSQEGGSGARKHHLVPASYLRRWADPSGRIRQVMVNEATDHVTSAEKAARETDYYRLEADEVDPDELPPLLMETLLGYVESAAAPILDVLTSGTPNLAPDQAAMLGWFIGLQMTRGHAYRREAQALAHQTFVVQYAGATDRQLRRRIADNGQEPTDAAVAEARDFLDRVANGDIIIERHPASVVGEAGLIAYDLGAYLFDRTWVVIETPPVMITTDEPVVRIPGPGQERALRGGVGNAAVIMVPLSPRHALAMFRPDIALAIGYQHFDTDQLDYLETFELCTELKAHSERWCFEHPRQRVAARLWVPPAPQIEALERMGSLETGDGTGELYRTSRSTRWGKYSSPPPWPVSRWWHE